MSNTFPGTTVEVSRLKKGSSKALFGGIFATGGITLSQVSIMTGLEPYLIQNWVKRGFVPSPVKRLYSEEQFARIIIINMLKEALQIERICSLIRVIGGVLEDTTDDLISDAELYHRYVDMLADESINVTDPASVRNAAVAAASDFVERIPNTRKKLERIFEVMLYAHAAAQFRASAEQMLSTIK